MKELSELETYEVSLVPKGANGKKFLIFKNLMGKKSMPAAKKLVDHVTKDVDPEVLKQVQKILKDFSDEHADAPMSEKAKAALQAVVRILSPMKDELSPEIIAQVIHAAGIDMSSSSEEDETEKDEHRPGEMDDEDEDEEDGDDSEEMYKVDMKAVPEDILSDMKDVLKEGAMSEDEVDKKIGEHMGESMKKAMHAYKSNMKKLGYRKYPDAEMQMKEFKQVDVEDENHAHGEAQPMDKIDKSAFDLSKVDAKQRPALEAIFKAQKESVEKAEKLEKELKDERELRRDREFIAKADGLKVGAKSEDIAKILKALDNQDPETAKALETILKAAGEQISKGKLFEEMGTSSQGTLPGKDSYAKIEAIAKSMVEKSDSKITQAQAIEAVLKTDEGQRLYGEYKNSRKDGI